MNDPDLVLPTPVQTAPLAEMRNHTDFPSQYFQMIDLGDEVFHVIVSRVTYDFSRLQLDGTPALASHQTPLVDADIFHGDSATSSCLQESDFAPYKPRCDIILANASAFAPLGKAERRWPVGLAVANMQKILVVTGPRYVERNIMGWKVSEPERALEVPLRWELAFGGTCQWPLQIDENETPEVWSPHLNNPIGRGWVDKDWLAKSRVADVDAPQIELFDRPFDTQIANSMQYPSIGVGVVGKWWSPRRQKAGTYDQSWKESRWPRQPLDFDFGYWNCAPEDQQIDYPQGGERVALAGMASDGRDLRFFLPSLALHTVVRLQIGPILPMPMRIDTLIFDLKAKTLTCVHRIQVAASFDVRVLELRNGPAPQ